MNDDPDFISKINIAANAVSEKFVQKVNACISIIESGRYDKNGISFSATTDEVNEAINFLLQYFDADSLMSKQLGIYNQSGASTGIEGLKCAGFVHSGSTYVSMIYADDEVYSTIYSEYADSSSNSADNENYSVERTDFVETADAKYNYFVLPFPEDKALTALVNDEYIVADDDSFFKLASPVSEQLAFVNQLIDSLEKVFLWVGIVMALFSMLLLFNFISVSISNKKKEIGILRAIGASRHNISQVFNAETFIIGLCAGLIGIGLTLLILIPGNMLIHHLAGTTDISAVLPVVPAVVLILLSVLLTLIGGLIPSRKAAKSDPVTALRTE